jgi:hypothetical protein
MQQQDLQNTGKKLAVVLFVPFFCFNLALIRVKFNHTTVPRTQRGYAQPWHEFTKN